MTRTNVQNPAGRFIILVIVINGIPRAWMVRIPNNCWVNWIAYMILPTNHQSTGVSCSQ